MFDLGWSELLIIFVLALVVLGPRELPKAIRKISAVIKQLRGMAREFQSGLDDMVKDTEFEDARSALREVQRFNPRNQIRNLIDPDRELDREMKIDFGDETPEKAAASKQWRESAKGRAALGLGEDGADAGATAADPAIDASDAFPAGKVPPKYQAASSAAALKGGNIVAPGADGSTGESLGAPAAAEPVAAKPVKKTATAKKVAAPQTAPAEPARAIKPAGRKKTDGKQADGSATAARKSATATTKAKASKSAKEKASE